MNNPVERHRPHHRVLSPSWRSVLIGACVCVLTLCVGAPTLAAPQEMPVKVGFILPDSGPLAAEARSLQAGFDLFLKEKRPERVKFQLIRKDIGPEEDRVVESMTDLVFNEKVEFLIGPLGVEASEKAIHGVAGVTTIMFVLNPAVRLVGGELCRPGTFRVGVTTYQSAQPLGSWFMKHVGPKVLVTGNDESICNEQADFFAFHFERAGGTFADRIMVQGDDPKEIDAILDAIRQIKPSGVFAAFRGKKAVAFLKAFRNASPPIECPVVGPAQLTAFPEVLTAAGESGAGVKTLAYLNDPVKLLSRIKTSLGRDVSDVARVAEGYDIAAVITDALSRRKADKFEHSEILQLMKEAEVEGCRGKLRFDKNHEPVLNGLLQEWAFKAGEWQHQVIESIGECRSPDFGCGRVGFPVTPGKETFQEPDLLDEGE
ncbi:MAG: ABC transporter substrate-binding protein [Thermodesulfobacteriota bacterium]